MELTQGPGERAPPPESGRMRDLHRTDEADVLRLEREQLGVRPGRDDAAAPPVEVDGVLRGGRRDVQKKRALQTGKRAHLLEQSRAQSLPAMVTAHVEERELSLVALGSARNGV